MFAVAAAAVAVVVTSSLNVSNAVDDLHFFCDKAVRNKYCGGGGGAADDRDREWVPHALPRFCDTTMYFCKLRLDIALLSLNAHE